MKQLIQYFRTGETEIIDSPVPTAGAKNLVIESQRSLISVGTEKMLLNFGKASMINKAKQQPDKVKQVIDKVKTEGLLSTVEAVWTKLNDPIPLGYSNVGEIVETGGFVTDFKRGDRVVSNGPHAEFVSVPWTLAAKIPEKVDDESAAFAVLGSIAMQGWRLINPTLGETIVVIGLGLLGQLTMQIARANGCRVIGFDIDDSKIETAKNNNLHAVKSSEVEKNVSLVHQLTNGIGADGIIITASADSEEILSQSAMMCRQRGRIVLVGVVPITVPRNLFYEKELTFQVSSSYGPGRYDPVYERKGVDYPLPFVRWTAKRNMESFLFLLENEKVVVKSLISHRYKFDQIRSAYSDLDSINPLGVLIEYAEKKDNRNIIEIKKSSGKVETKKNEPVIGLIGVGNFAKMTMLPALKEIDANIKTIATLEGYSAAIAAKKTNVKVLSSDAEHIFKDVEINTVIITTPHSSHAALVLQGLKSGKNIFVEKPLALTFEDLKQIYKVKNKKSKLNLMVGFNRRFAPTTNQLINRLKNRIDPVSVIITVNAGAIPMDHWVHDPETGGGRILGEACHFIDLARFITGSEIEMVSAMSTQNHSGTDEDKVIITLSFKDGSHASVHYLANGNKSFPKERIEIFSSEKVYVIDNFKTLKSYGDNLKIRGMKQEKGHSKGVNSFLQSIKEGKPSPIPEEELFEIHLATIAVNLSVAEKKNINIADLWEKLQS